MGTGGWGWDSLTGADVQTEGGQVSDLPWTLACNQPEDRKDGEEAKERPGL